MAKHKGQSKMSNEQQKPVVTDQIGETKPDLNTGVGVTVSKDTTVITPKPEDKDEPKTPVMESKSDTEDLRAKLSKTSLNTLADKVSQFPSAVANTLETYAKNMALNMTRTREEIDTNQRNIFDVYHRVVTLPADSGPIFAESLGEILKAVHKYRDGAFHETAALRGMETVRLSTTQRRMLEELTNVFQLLSDPAARTPDVKNVIDLETLLVNCGITEEQRTRMVMWISTICRIS